MIVRDAVAADGAAIRNLLASAFEGTAEADLVEQLRADGDVSFELVAEEDGRLVGQVLLSRMVSPFRALALGPVAVAPERQRSGVGSRLIEEAHRRARGSGFDAVFVLGDPAYYGRFGYDLAAADGFESPYSGPHFMALPLNGSLPASSGPLRHAPAFAALG